MTIEKVNICCSLQQQTDLLRQKPTAATERAAAAVGIGKMNEKELNCNGLMSEAHVGARAGVNGVDIDFLRACFACSDVMGKTVISA